MEPELEGYTVRPLRAVVGEDRLRVHLEPRSLAENYYQSEADESEGDLVPARCEGGFGWTLIMLLGTIALITAAVLITLATTIWSRK